MAATLDELLATARRHGLDVTAERPDLDQSGLDHAVAHAADAEGVRWILRAPRRADVYTASAAERRVLGFLRGRLPVAVPDWRVHAPDLIAYPRLPGRPGWVLDAETSAPTYQLPIDPLPDAFVGSAAATLAALHTIDRAAAAGAGLRIRTIAEVRETLARDMDTEREALGVSDTMWRRWQAWLADDASWPPAPALIHGDLHPGHMLLDDDHRLIGVLDWTEAQVGDPAVDLAMWFGVFGAAALDAVLDRYAAAGGPVWPRIRDHAIARWHASPVMAAAFARMTGNPAILAFGRSMLASFEA